MLFDDIVKSMCGVNEDNTPRCGFSVNKEIYKIGDTEPIQSLSRISSRPNIQMSRIPGYDKTYIKVDIYIDKLSKSDANMFLSYFNSYGKEVSEVTDESETIPQIFCTFVPLEYEGRYYIVASLPLFWSLCASTVGGDVDMFTVLFDAENVVLYETNEIDYENILAIVEGEVEQEMEYQDKLLEKQAMNKQRLAKRDEMSSRARINSEMSPTDILRTMDGSNDTSEEDAFEEEDEI